MDPAPVAVAYAAWSWRPWTGARGLELALVAGPHGLALAAVAYGGWARQAWS
ncbi:MAG TPA: hypothetical protein VLJ42_11670 [Solirubrobacteraceae bacterium]|nr:hypothetical protein [Solirubrobacteraceae bacterium]